MSITLAGLKSAGRTPALPKLIGLHLKGNHSCCTLVARTSGKRLARRLVAGMAGGSLVKAVCIACAPASCPARADGLLALQTSRHSIPPPLFLDSGEFGRWWPLYFCIVILKAQRPARLVGERR